MRTKLLLANKFKIPAIVSDIDGVLVRGSNPIGNSQNILKKLRQPLETFFPKSKEKSFFPFFCLTNGGGKLEQEKADQINKICHLSGELQLTKQNFILNFTPLRPIMEQYQNKCVFITGSGKIKEIAKDSGLKKFVALEHMQEYHKNYLSHFLSIEKQEILHEKLKNCEKLQDEELINKIKKFEFEAIFALHDPIEWESTFQIMLNILQRNPSVPIFVVNPDTLYSDQFPLPRFGFGPFTEVFKDIYLKIFKHPLKNVEYFGKPTRNTYKYVEEYLDSLSKYQLGNIYMIGDNPRSDIRGGNLSGWRTILVKSGVFQGKDNDEKDPAKYVVEDFEEAIKLIFKLEEINFE